MKTIITVSLIGWLATPLWAATPADEVKEAAGKLADKPNYSWTAKSQSTQTNRFRMEPPDGKTEKGGFTVLTYKNGENTTIAVRKGDKVAVKQDDEWKTGEELADPTGAGGNGGPGNRQQFMARRVQRTKLAAEEAQELLGRVKSLKKEGDGIYSGDL